MLTKFANWYFRNRCFCPNKCYVIKTKSICWQPLVCCGLAGRRQGFLGEIESQRTILTPAYILAQILPPDTSAAKDLLQSQADQYQGGWPDTPDLSIEEERRTTTSSTMVAADILRQKYRTAEFGLFT